MMTEGYVCLGRGLLLIALLGGVVPTSLAAQAPAVEVHAKGDLSGDWQGTLQAQKALRTIVRFTRTDKGYTAKFYSIDQGATPIPVSSVTVNGSSVKLGVDMIGGGYEGTLSADGNSIVGTWSQGTNPLPLTLVRATKETAWEIPAPPPPPKMMPADAKPSLEVATIKPNENGGPNMQGLGFGGRTFRAINASLGDLIAFAYGVQMKQISNGPEWMNKDRYDISGTPDVEGLPNPAQLKVMLQNLLKDRFKLTIHEEKKEMSAFVLTVAKTGPKIKVTELKGPGPGFGLRALTTGVSIPVRNATMADLSQALQEMVLDRPVVDESGLSGRYDFVLTFTADDSQFNGHPPQLNGQAPKSDSAEAAPNLFEAMQQELGLKLEPQKAEVPVIVIDHVEKPSAN
jgi:uncharacterized protein (TIGR03435 family)